VDGATDDLRLTARRGHRAAGEVALLLILCGVVFLPGLTALPWYGTEPLRVLVAREMYAAGDWPRPTIHGRPYLDKPPLFAWIVMSLARLLGHETIGAGVARAPSVAAAAGYVLVIWQAARRMIHPGCGLIAGLMALCNFSLIEYAVRAELDIGFMFFSALATLLLWPIARPVLDETTPRLEGPALFVWWSGVYAALVAASFWKAPHAFLFLLMTLLAIAATRRSWRWLFAPAHLVCGTAAVSIVAAWYVWLTRVTSAGTVEQKLAAELYHRLVPNSLEYVRDLVIGPVQMYVVTLPASFLAGMLAFGGIRRLVPEPHRPLLWFLACWLVPISVFLLFARADATRYLFPIFAPTTLLGTLVWLIVCRRSEQPSESALVRLAHALPTALAAGGAIATGLLAVLLLAGRLPATGESLSLTHGYAWSIVPALISAPLLAVWCIRVRDGSARLLLGLAGVLLSAKCAHQLWYAPSRAAEFDHARRIAALRSATHDGPLFVLARQPISEVVIGYPHPVRWPANVEEAFEYTAGAPAYFVVRSRDFAREVNVPPDRIVRQTNVETAKDSLVVLKIAPPTRP